MAENLENFYSDLNEEFYEIVDKDTESVNDVDNLAVKFLSIQQYISEKMNTEAKPAAKAETLTDEETDNITENMDLEVIPTSSIEKARDINEATEINTTIETSEQIPGNNTMNAEITPVNREEDQLMDHTDTRICMSDLPSSNLDKKEFGGTVEQYTEICDITDILLKTLDIWRSNVEMSKNGNVEAIPDARTDVVCKQMDQETDDIEVVGMTHIPVIKEATEIVHKTTEVITTIETSEQIPDPATEGLNEIVNLKSTEEIGQIMDTTADVIYIGEKYQTATSESTEEIDQMMDTTDDIIYMGEKYGAPTFESTEETGETMDLTANLLPNVEVNKTTDLETDYGNISKNAETAFVLNTEVTEASILNERTLDIMSNEQAGNKQTEDEKYEPLNLETKKVKNICGRKRKRRPPPVSEMVMDSIRCMERDNGFLFEDIKNYMEENYPVNVRALIKYHVNNFLQKCVDNEMLEKFVETDEEERYKFKKK